MAAVQHKSAKARNGSAVVGRYYLLMFLVNLSFAIGVLKMKKSLLAATLMSLFLAACGDNAANNAASAVDAAASAASEAAASAASMAETAAASATEATEAAASATEAAASAVEAAASEAAASK
jgi:hypothetical protein